MVTAGRTRRAYLKTDHRTIQKPDQAHHIGKKTHEKNTQETKRWPNTTDSTTETRPYQNN